MKTYEMKPIVVIETDCHGGGWICTDGDVESYAYDDGYLGDIKITLQTMIEMGIIPVEAVKFCDMESALQKIYEVTYGEER